MVDLNGFKIQKGYNDKNSIGYVDWRHRKFYHPKSIQTLNKLLKDKKVKKVKYKEQFRRLSDGVYHITMTQRDYKNIKEYEVGYRRPSGKWTYRRFTRLADVNKYFKRLL